MLDVLPANVIADLTAALKSGVERGQEGWPAAKDEEDTLTGHLCAMLQGSGGLWEPNAGGWKWTITYKKFRSKATGAPEKLLGADGIFQIEVRDSVNGEVERKGLLFQAKKGWHQRDGFLRDQVSRMEDVAPNGSAVFDYREDGFSAVSGHRVLAVDANPRDLGSDDRIWLGEFLVDRFLFCKVGLRGLYWEHTRGILTLPGLPRKPSAVYARIRHFVRIDVRHTRRGLRDIDR